MGGLIPWAYIQFKVYLLIPCSSVKCAIQVKGTSHLLADFHKTNFKTILKCQERRLLPNQSLKVRIPLL